MNDTTKNYEIVSKLIEDYNLTPDQILQLFTNYNGLQIMTDDFVQFVNDEIGL